MSNEIINNTSAQNDDLQPHPAAAASSLGVTLADLFDALDAALMQVTSISKMAGNVVWSETDESRLDVSHALDAIRNIGGSAAANLDTVRIEIDDALAQLRAAAA